MAHAYISIAYYIALVCCFGDDISNDVIKYVKKKRCVSIILNSFKFH